MALLTDLEKLETILQHQKRVEQNAILIAKELLSEDRDLALSLVRRGREHDNSKFSSFEFDHLWSNDAQFSLARSQHHNSNNHHPERFSLGIHGMTELDLAEMVCDCTARAQEFGTDARNWFLEVATKRFGFEMSDSIGCVITKYLDLLTLE